MPKIYSDGYFWASMPVAITFFLRGWASLLVPDTIQSVVASHLWLIGDIHPDVTSIVWICVGWWLCLEACGFVKPLWAQYLIRGFVCIVVWDVQLLANYRTFFVEGTPFILGALTAHWGITLVWTFAAFLKSPREFTKLDYIRKESARE